MVKKTTKKTTKKKTSKKRGRKSLYDPKFATIAKFLCDRGADDQEIADCLGVSRRTINYWKKDHPEFLHSLKKGKDYFDKAIERKLAERAMGYEHVDTKFFCYEGAIIAQEYNKHYPPDVTACIYWLNNRKPNEWASRKAVETTMRPDSNAPAPLIAVPGVMSIEDWEKLGVESLESIRKKQAEMMKDDSRATES